MKEHYYHSHALSLKRELRDTISVDVLKQLHQKACWKHFVILFRQLVIIAIAVYGIFHLEYVWQWLVCSIALGFVAFGWTVLLHEVIHDAIFVRKNTRLNSLLGYCYAIAGGMSKTQFTTWHLDHHNELGSFSTDPKRAHLTPKIIRRWYKLLYMTPALFPIYFRAAARETSSYPRELQRKIKKERIVMLLCHLLLIVYLAGFGFDILLRIYLIPYLFIFPIAFTINRLGQHYSIDPEDPAHWTSLIRGNFFWDFVYIYSNYHLEHHYFPRIPCYNLPKAQKLLEPLYIRHNITPQSYLSLLYHWLILNKLPHTNWFKG